MSNSKKKVEKKKVEVEDKLHHEYAKYSKENEEKYGKKTIVLLHNGKFFEVYGVQSLETGEYQDSKILEFSDTCQAIIAPRPGVMDKFGRVVMAGVPTVQLDKYLQMLLDAGYTVCVYVQEEKQEKGKNFKRYLDKVYSPGTFISCDTDTSPKITNNIMCVWMHLAKPVFKTSPSRIKDVITYGVSVVNIFTGKSAIFESQSPFIMTNTTFDELERYVSVYSPSEVILLSPFDTSDIQKIIQYTGIKTNTIHKINTKDVTNQKVVNCENQRYIKKILSAFYKEDTFDLCAEFHENIMATQSFCYLLNFIQEHNPDLIRKINIPTFNNTSDRMVLANHTLMQLNIIDDGSNSYGQYSSVLSFLNKCCSSIGKRMFQYQITNPTFDEDWLNKEYDIVSKMLDNYVMVDSFRKIILKIKDVEKIIRQIIIKKVYPSSIATLYKSIDCVSQINTCLYELPDICDYLCGEFTHVETSYNYIDSLCSNISKFINKKFIVENCEKVSSMTNFEYNVIQRGVSEKLDAANDEYVKCKDTFITIRNYLNDLMQKNEKSSELDYVNMQKKEKSGEYLQITTVRSKKLQPILAGIISHSTSQGKITLDNNVIVNLSEITFKSAGSSSNTMDIESPQLTDLNKRMLVLKDTINTLISEAYLNVLNELENKWIDDIENITTYIAKVDVMQCKTYLAKQYNYCKPEIDSDSDSSYINVTDLRHCLIEHIQQNEIYVTNDICLGQEEKGVLLYGTNAVGKTSLIRAIGISVIMAQSGIYVPCSKFVYKPYSAIYSRILGNDNIFKGLSTFAVEMSELRVILENADNRSLILGDELCSGTEKESALSIFGAGLMDLAEQEVSFIFATHFHEILIYDEIKAIPSIATKHMTVHYDRQDDCLVYDRKLKEGSGDKNYGLEVCKSMHLSDRFLEKAYFLRNKYYPETKGILSTQGTSYNARKLKSVLCEKCGINKAEEVHHLQQQKDANDNGFIGTFHKNHPANLQNICQECHDKIHAQNDAKTVVRKKTTKGFKTM